MLLRPWMIRTCFAGLCAIASPAMGQTCLVHPTQRLEPINLAVDARFGTSVAMSGSIAVVGAPYDATAAGFTGTAHVFRQKGGAWVREQVLTPADPSFGTGFAESIAVAGDTIIVGASADDQFGLDAGAAYVFRFDGVQWSQTQKLRAATTGANHRFGTSVALNDHFAVIGSPWHFTTRGSVAVFEWNGTIWQEIQLLTPPATSVGTVAFGSTVAMSGDLLVVGAPRQGGPAFGCGAVHAFRSVNGMWKPEQVLFPSQPMLNGEMGYSMACDADIIIAAYRLPTTLVGPVDVFHHDGQQWTFEQRIVGNPEDYLFGAACAEHDGVLYVAAPYAYVSPDFAGYHAGVVHRYTRSGDTWTRDRSSYTNVFDESSFGTSIATNGEVLLAGTPFHAPTGRLAGAAYIVPLHQPDCNASGILDDCELPDCNGNRVPDDCELASGALHDCNRNEIPDECEAPLNYVLDGGNSEIVWGITGPGDYLWLNQFNVVPGAEIVTAIEIAWSHYTWENIPATLLLYKDPTSDGNPIDAVLLQAVQTQTRNSTSGAEVNLQRVNIPPTFVGLPGDKFFVGALVTQPFYMGIAAADYTPPVLMNWRKLGYPDTIDIHNLSSGDYVISAVQRNWLIRAIAGDCDGDGIANHCEIDNGAADQNANGIPDECERLCPADLFPPSGGDQVINIDDLAFLITHWNQSNSPADLNLDRVVNIDDLVLLITHWGPCR